MLCLRRILALGLVRAFFPAEAMTAPPMHRMLVITLCCAVLALVYVVGTSREYRRQQRDPWRHMLALERPERARLGAHHRAMADSRYFFSPTGLSGSLSPLMLLRTCTAGYQNVPSGLAVVLLWVATWLFPWWHAVRATGPQFPDIATIIGPGIGAVLAVLVSAAYRYLLAEAVHHQRLAAALQATQLDLAATQHRAGQLEERERLAREIHDTLAQGFSSILLVSRAAGQHQQTLPSRTRQSLELIEETAAANLTEARELIQHLNTTAPADSLRTQLHQLTKRYETELTVRHQPVTIPGGVEGRRSLNSFQHLSVRRCCAPFKLGWATSLRTPRLPERSSRLVSGTTN